MIARNVLSDLLAAERGLARFDAHLADPGRARRYACDAARRSVLAMASLEGVLVSAEDLALALVAPDEVELPQRQEAGTAAGLYRLLVALHDGLRPPVAEPGILPRDGRLRPETIAAWSSLAAETRRLLVEAEAALQDGGAADQTPGGSGGEPLKPLVPWTLAWAEEIHARWYEARHSRRPSGWSPAEQETAHNALRLIDQALTADPGVVGGARALHRLHSVAELPNAPTPASIDEDEQSRSIRHYIASQPEAGWWPQFVRIVVPLLVARASRLDRTWLPISSYWGRNHAGYRLALSGSEEGWIAWTARLLADVTQAEHARLDAIEARHAAWIAATAEVPRLPKRRSETLGPTRRHRKGSRRSTSRLPRLLELLWEQPMVSTRAVERQLGMTYRSALDLIQDLEKAEVLRRATERKLDRLWLAHIL